MKENKIAIGDIVEGILNFNASGSSYLTSDDLPKDIYVHSSKSNKSIHLDHVKVEIIKGKGRAIEGKVIELVKRSKDEFVGVLQLSQKYAFLVPDSKKMPIDIFIPLSKLMGAIDGQKVIGKITNWKDGAKSPNGEIIKVLGNAGNNDVEIHAILHDYGLPYDFDEDVISESEMIPLEIPEDEIEKRRDMRDVLTFTIDGFDSRDLDDAISVEWVDGLLKLGIHIADVSHYVRPSSELSKEAFKRGTSVYLVDRVVPMFPERLSNNICSLNPNTDKLVYSFIFTLNRNGKLIDEEFCRGVINTDYRLTYDYVSDIIKGGEAHTKDLRDALLVADRYAKMIRKERVKDTLLLNSREVKFKLDENKKPIGVIVNESNDAHKLIEEFMVLTNRRVCEFLTKKSVPTIHRTHGSPDPTKIGDLKEFINTLGFDIKITNPDEMKTSINKLLVDIKGTTYEDMISNLVIRTQQKAIYQTDNEGHWGMGLKYYTHVTSPIRRFSDYKIHQILTEVLPNKGYPVK